MSASIQPTNQHTKESVLDQEKADKKRQTNLFVSHAGNGDCYAISNMIRNGFDPNSPNDLGLTALFMAAMFGKDKTIDVLLSHGANPNIRDSLGSTALHVCVADAPQPSVKCINLLIGAGAQIDAQDNEGKTPLNSGLSGFRMGQDRLKDESGLICLADHGANFLKADNEGKTPADIILASTPAEGHKILFSSDMKARAQAANTKKELLLGLDISVEDNDDLASSKLKRKI